jgi:hypothetical protein
MNAPLPTITIPALGAQLEGGFFHGVVLIDGQLWGEVTGPKADCHVSGLAWHPDYTDIAGALSDFDGLANTRAMAAAGSPLAQAALACRSGGFDDWAIPARGSQLLQWAHLKPLLPEAEAFATKWHWSSTQFSRYYAFNQLFNGGYTYDSGKSWEGGCARFVRRFPLGH